MRKILLIICILLYTNFFSQEGYQIEFNKRDGFIDFIKGSRYYVEYVEKDADTGLLLNHREISYFIFINYERTYSDDTIGKGVITIYIGEKPFKFLFSEVYAEKGGVAFYSGNNRFAAYFPKEKQFILYDAHSRIYRYHTAK